MIRRRRSRVYPRGSGIDSPRQILSQKIANLRMARNRLGALFEDSPRARAPCPPAAARTRAAVDGEGALRGSSYDNKFLFGVRR